MVQVDHYDLPKDMYPHAGRKLPPIPIPNMHSNNGDCIAEYTDEGSVNSGKNNERLNKGIQKLCCLYMWGNSWWLTNQITNDELIIYASKLVAFLRRSSFTCTYFGCFCWIKMSIDESDHWVKSGVSQKRKPRGNPGESWQQ